MSPILDLQRRMVEAGRIRAGDKGDRGQPQKLANWRLTSKDRVRLQAAAGLWGGEVREWQDRDGEFELYTDTDTLPIMLLPGQLPTTWYELWSKGGCQRRCDGQHELISDASCLCGEDKECKPTTRLSVLLPDLVGVGSWLVSSTGWNAAAELAGAAELLSTASAQGMLIPARLRLEQRVEVKSGQTRRFAVPVIDVDVSFRELLGGQGGLTTPLEQPALPSGYVPLAGNGGNGVSLEQGLLAAETQTAQRTARSAAPIPAADDIEFGSGPVPVPEDPGASALSPASADATPPTPQVEPEWTQSQRIAQLYAELTRVEMSAEDREEVRNRYVEGDEGWLAWRIQQARPEKPLTLAQAKKKMNAIVAQLREQNLITTVNLWAALANERKLEVEEMIELLEGRDAEGELHWSPLRDSLTLEEARALHGRLARLWANTQEPVTA